MDLNIVLAVICGAVALVGAFCVVFQIYHMTVIDATARGLKHPKFWGVFTMSGNNSSGLLMYLIGRRKYPIVNVFSLSITNPFDNLINSSLLYFSSTATISSATNT
jgi:DMSO reductase anchor subunit